MSTDAQRVLSDALSLSAPERALLAESLLESLDRTDATVDSLWAREAEDRLAAFEAGTMDTTDAADVFAEFDRS
jgi:hypothetical protein